MFAYYNHSLVSTCHTFRSFCDMKLRIGTHYILVCEEPYVTKKGAQLQIIGQVCEHFYIIIYFINNYDEYKNVE